jgi:hypothetical protein
VTPDRLQLDPVALAVDASNYTPQAFTPNLLQLAYDAGVRLFVVQAVAPPSGYPPSKTHDQVAALLDFGFPVASYAFWWAGAGTDFLKRHLDTLDGFEGRILAIEIDLEDTTIGLLAGVARPTLSPQHAKRIARQARPEIRVAHDPSRRSITRYVDDIQGWADVLTGYPTLGLQNLAYSGPWYFGPYLGNPTFLHDQRWGNWTAIYDGDPDTANIVPYGGWTAPAEMKQYAGDATIAGLTGIDLSAINPAYLQAIADHWGGAMPNPSPQPGPIDYGWLGRKDAIVRTGGEFVSLADQMDVELKRSYPRKTVLRGLSAGVRSRGKFILDG